MLEHHQRRGSRPPVAEAAVGERYVSDLEREVLNGQLTVRHRGDNDIVQLRFRGAHDSLRQLASLDFILTASGYRTPREFEMQTLLVSGGRPVALQLEAMDLKDKPTRRVCSVADALSTVGDHYSLLIVREIGYGYVRFKDLVAFTGAPRDVLT